MANNVPEPETVHTAATDLLEEVAECLDQAGRPLPSRIFVSPGTPAWDCCDGLIAEVTRIYPAPVASSRRPVPSCAGGDCWMADVTLHLLRCVPGMDNDGNPPSAQALDDAAFGLHADGAVMVSCRACHAGCDPLCTAQDLQGYDIKGPQGNCAAVTMKLTLTLPRSA